MQKEKSATQIPKEAVQLLEPIIKGIVKTVGSNFEVVVHDFGLLPNSIVAIAGNVTGRTVGGPMTGFGFKLVSSSCDTDVINYSSETLDGRKLKSSTVFIKNEKGSPIGCVCMNMDLTEASIAKHFMERLCGTLENQSPQETFIKDVPGILEDYLKWTMAKVDLPPKLMMKEHKLSVVRDLDSLGAFNIKGAVEYVAKELAASRYTIYNYIDQVRANEE